MKFIVQLRRKKETYDRNEATVSGPSRDGWTDEMGVWACKGDEWMDGWMNKLMC